MNQNKDSLLQPKLMILGAGPGQLPMIERAVELGCHVITVDNLPENCGHKRAQQQVHCSTTDKEGVLRAARELQIQGIVTFASDVATPTVAYVAQHLGLAGCGTEVAAITSNKANFKHFQKNNALNHPAFGTVTNPVHLGPDILQISPPLIVKPVDSSGSRGVVRVDTLDTKVFEEALVYAQNFSRSGEVVVESFLEGGDVSGDGFLINGQLFAVITQKYKQGFIPIGHGLPTNLPAALQELIVAEVSKTCALLGYRDGPIDFDVIVNDHQAVVVEMSPRLGGNGIPQLVEHYCGIDFIELSIRQALGMPNTLPDRKKPLRPCASWIIGSPCSGKLEFAATETEMRARVPQIFYYQFNYQINDSILRFEHSGNGLGYVLFEIPPNQNYSAMVQQLTTALNLTLAEQSSGTLCS